MSERMSGFWLGVFRQLRGPAGSARKLEQAVEAACHEAFMTGRVYAAGGEKETPAEIHEKLLARCRVAFGRSLRGKDV